MIYSFDDYELDMSRAMHSEMRSLLGLNEPARQAVA